MNHKITLRQKEILEIIFNQNEYTTISSIAERLNISSKTVFRELPIIEKWLKAYKYTLEKKSGLGIKIKEPIDNREELINLLYESKEVKEYSPKERQLIIISELLQNRHSVKLYNFTRILNVTEGTVSNDLDKIDQWFKKYSISLIRKPGLGVYIEGEEGSIRRATVNLIYENINEYELIDLIKKSLNKSSVINRSRERITRERLLNLIDINAIKRIEMIVKGHEKNLGYKLTDNAYIGLIVHVTLAIKRMEKNEKIVIDKSFLHELKKFPEYKDGEELANKLSKEFNIAIPEDEVGYITMHLKGLKSLNTSGKTSNSTIGNFTLVRVAREMIKIAESEIGGFLEENEGLLVGLVSHLGPAISRLRMKLDIRNPLLEEIKKHYPNLMELASKCSVAVEKQFNVTMPESEIAYIAMHLGAVIERKQRYHKRIFKVAVSCVTGMGTSGLLATRIEKEYDNIEVIDMISIINIEEAWIKDKGIDFIISTVPIENSIVPVVVVNPLIFQQDKININNLIKGFSEGKIKAEKREIKKSNLKEILLEKKRYIEGILQILNNFFLEEYNNVEHIHHIIDNLCDSFNIEDEKKLILKSDLVERENKGSTFITGYNAALLHCKSKGVEEVYFGVIRVASKVAMVNGKNEREELKLAFIMIAPEKAPRAYLEILSYISKMIIEKKSFFEKLKNGEPKDIYNYLSNILEDFYKSNNKL